MFVLLVILFLALGSAAQASSLSQDQINFSTPQRNLVTSRVISPAEQQAALAFWTHDAIAQAQPLPMPVQLGPAEIDQTALSQPEITGEPGFAAAGLAASDADQVAQAAYPDDWARLEENEAATAGLDSGSLLGPEGSSQTHTSYTVNQAAALQTMYPHRWIGRLSFSVPGGTSYCSATSISGNVMLTAAHCLYDSTNNAWYSNWVFTPAYRNGSAPYGTFPATQCWVLTDWVNLVGLYAINTWARHDVGVCKMGVNSAGQTLNAAVGWMGRQWNYSYIRHFHDLGYPFRDYNDALLAGAGLYLRTCVAESFQQTVETRGMGCYYGRGISGGPWMVGYAVSLVAGAADGVNSGLFIGTQNMYGPRFNSNNIVPLCTAATC
jgi:V8-like Glu-specific endopeptidase